MSATDFPKAVARVSEGFCPLCDEELRRGDTLVVQLPSGETRTHSERGICLICDVDWKVSMVDGRPVLWHSRSLTPDEIKRLHDRGDEN